MPGSGKLEVEHFRLTATERPIAGKGEALLRVLYIPLAAASRAWMQSATSRDYDSRAPRSALSAGNVMSGRALAEVVESDDSTFNRGDLVFAETGWQDYAVLPAPLIEKLPALKPVTYLLSVYGITGLTAYFGLLDCGKPAPGETVVVSAAAGAVGTIVGQIAKMKSCRVVGITGGAEKCRWLVDELGFDAAIDYKAGALRRQIKEIVPEGIDVFFDNTGGEIFEACLHRMNVFGRIACCGAVSQYDGAAPSHGPRGIPGLVVTKRLTLRGFVVMDFDDRREHALAELHEWVAAGRLKIHEDVIDGLANAPAALIGLLAGENRGKRIVKVR